MIDSELSTVFNRRAFLVLSGVGIMTGVLLLRMMQLQIFSSHYYKKLADNNSFKTTPIVPLRGIIKDRNDNPLATNKVSYHAYIVPREIKDFNKIIEVLKNKFNPTDKKIKDLEKQYSRNRRSYTPIIVRENINWNDMSELKASEDIPGFYIEQGYLRFYPNESMAAHTIGYVGNVSESDLKKRFDPLMEASYFKTGKSGIEKRFDAGLRGVSGQNTQMTNAAGKVIQDSVNVIPAVPGEDIKTTISIKVQKSLENAFKNYPTGAGVVMDIYSGDVLGIASTPSFNPNKFQEDDLNDYFKELMDNEYKPFTNKAIEGSYPPGSTFKIVVAMAALESGAVTPYDRIYCPGYWEYGNHRYHCWKKDGHGWENMIDAIAHSCDIYFYQVALKIGVDAIKNMANKLGLGEVLQNDLLGEVRGIIPDRKWKERYVGAPWVHGDTIITGIGQGFVLATPLQLCTMVSRFLSNTNISPRIVEYSESRNLKNLGMSRKNIDIVMEGMRKVVSKGGTAEVANVKVGTLGIGGKTGTSQVRRISTAERKSGVRSNEQLPFNLRNHGLFVGFAPDNNPRYAIAVITEHSGGSTNAATICRDVLKEILKEGV